MAVLVREVERYTLKQRLRHIARAVLFQAVKVHPLVRGVLVYEHKLRADFDDDIGLESLPHYLVVGDRLTFNILNRFFHSFDHAVGSFFRNFSRFRSNFGGRAAIRHIEPGLVGYLIRAE